MACRMNCGVSNDPNGIKIDLWKGKEFIFTVNIESTTVATFAAEDGIKPPKFQPVAKSSFRY